MIGQDQKFSTEYFTWNNTLLYKQVAFGIFVMTRDGPFKDLNDFAAFVYIFVIGREVVL